jgi:hypothetical protein
MYAYVIGTSHALKKVKDVEKVMCYNGVHCQMNELMLSCTYWNILH